MTAQAAGPGAAPADFAARLAGHRGILWKIANSYCRASEDPRWQRLYDALRELGDLDRALVLLHFEDRSHREIAEVLGISESNVGTKLNRLKQTMRHKLAAEGES